MFVAAVGTNAVMAQEVAKDGAKIDFSKEVHDYGTIENGANGQCTFEFKNTGNAPLIISNAKGSCGCTVPQCPKVPIAPGATGKIEVKFNSKGKKNKQTKKVTVTANTDPAQTILTITADVTPAAPAASPVK